jgi:hypothetical protein
VNGGAWVYLPSFDHVHPGDHMFGEVVAGQGSGGGGFPGGPTFPAAGQYLFFQVNTPEGWSFWAIEPPKPLAVPPPDQTAEYIVEQPSCFWICQALAQYGQVTFTQMGLSENELAFPFGSVSSPAIFPGFSRNLMTGSTLKETGAPLVGGNQETVTWLHK